MVKTCTCCNKELSIKLFYIRKDRDNSYTAWCKKCTSIKVSSYRNKEKTKKYKAEYYIKNKNKKLNNDLKKYNLTLKDYNDMLAIQENSCAICKHEVDKRLSVDHCHKTGKVRGLLCSSCNFILGHADDSIEVLFNAIEYLKNAQ